MHLTNSRILINEICSMHAADIQGNFFAQRNNLLARKCEYHDENYQFYSEEDRDLVWVLGFTFKEI